MKLLWCWAVFSLLNSCNGASLANRVERSAEDSATSTSSSSPSSSSSEGSNTADTTTGSSGAAIPNTVGQRLKKRSINELTGAISLNCRTIVLTGITDARRCSRLTGREVARHFRMRTQGHRVVRESGNLWNQPREELWNQFESDDFWNESSDDDWWNDHSDLSFRATPSTSSSTTPSSTTPSTATSSTTPTSTASTTATPGAQSQGFSSFNDPYYFRDTLPGNCRFDLNRAALDPSTACLCAATAETCTLGRSGCFWNKDKKTGMTECISNAERFYVRLAQLLRERGKKSFAINIKYGATGARGELPLGPWGPAVIGYGNPSPSKTIGLFEKPKHHFNYSPLPGNMGGSGPRHKQPQSHEFMGRTSQVLNANNSATSHNEENMFENDWSKHGLNVGDSTNPWYQGQKSGHERRGRMEVGSGHMFDGGMQGLGAMGVAGASSTGRGGFRSRSTGNFGFGTHAGEGGERVTGMSGGMGSSMPMAGSGMRGLGTSSGIMAPDMTGSNMGGEFSTPWDSGMAMGGGMGGPGMAMGGGMARPGMAMGGGMARPGMAMGGGMARPGMAMGGGMRRPGMAMGGGMGEQGMAMSGGMARPGMALGGGMRRPGMAGPGMGGGMAGGMAGPGMGGPGMGGGMAGPGMGGPGMAGGMAGPGMAPSGGMVGGMGGPGMAMG